jgi:hypothetical protein
LEIVQRSLPKIREFLRSKLFRMRTVRYWVVSARAKRVATQHAFRAHYASSEPSMFDNCLRHVL